jgi:hypothetical protein
MIHYLLPRGHVSLLHRIDADQGWHLYAGGPLEIYELDEADAAAAAHSTRLGTDFSHGARSMLSQRDTGSERRQHPRRRLHSRAAPSRPALISVASSWASVRACALYFHTIAT